MDTHEYYINKTVRYIKNSNVDFKYRVGACLLLSKSPMSIIGICQNKSHPIQLKYSNNMNRIFLHAEIDTLRKVAHSRYLGYEPSTMYIVRILKNGSFSPSRPCDICASAITAFKVQKVIYFEQDNWHCVKLAINR